MTEDAAAFVDIGVNPAEHFTTSASFEHVCIIHNHAYRIFRIPGIAASGYVCPQFPIDVAKDVSPINILI